MRSRSNNLRTVSRYSRQSVSATSAWAMQCAVLAGWFVRRCSAHATRCESGSISADTSQEAGSFTHARYWSAHLVGVSGDDLARPEQVLLREVALDVDDAAHAGRADVQP